MLNSKKIIKINKFIKTKKMGCCHGIRHVTFQSKEYIINLAPKEIEDIMEDNCKSCSEKKYRKHSSKTDVTNFESPKKKNEKTGKNFR